MSFWDVIWFIIVSFAFIAYLMLLFWIITDLFRNKNQSGWIKALWIVLLIFLPLLASLVYLIVYGDDMTKRSVEYNQQVRDAQDAYIRDVAGSGKTPTEQIADAKALLDSGALTQSEFDAIKAKALS